MKASVHCSLQTNGVTLQLMEKFKYLGVTFLSFFFFFYFNLYIYPPDSQESDRGAIHRVGNYPDLLPEMPRYCCPLVI